MSQKVTYLLLLQKMDNCYHQKQQKQQRRMFHRWQRQTHVYFTISFCILLLINASCFLELEFTNAFQMPIRTTKSISPTKLSQHYNSKYVSSLTFKRQYQPLSKSNSNQNSSRLYLNLWDKDTSTTASSSSSTTENTTTENTTTTTTTTTTKNNSNNKIFQPGTGPTIIIEPNEPDQLIYSSAISRTISWVIAAILFGTGLYLSVGPDTAEEFFAGYLVEQSLSIDNLFVFLLLFDYFNVPLMNQDRVLNYGIYGAIVMRAVMIGLGSVALSQYHGILLIFAGILIYSSGNVLWNLVNGGDDDEEEEDMSENSIVKFSRNLFDSTNEFDGNKFFTIENGIKKATPLFICLVAVEISDVVFAVDSIPAVFGVTEVSFVLWMFKTFDYASCFIYYMCVLYVYNNL